eukprot:jgi/Mesvir1/3466/Mv11959-RA.1
MSQICSPAAAYLRVRLASVALTTAGAGNRQLPLSQGNKASVAFLSSRRLVSVSPKGPKHDKALATFRYPRRASTSFVPRAMAPTATATTGTTPPRTAEDPTAQNGGWQATPANASEEAALLQAFASVPDIPYAYVVPSDQPSGAISPTGVDVIIATSQRNLLAGTSRKALTTLHVPETTRALGARSSDLSTPPTPLSGPAPAIPGLIPLTQMDGLLAPTHWSPFPWELSGIVAVVPSPSGSLQLVIREGGFDAKAGAAPGGGYGGTRFEIWGRGQLLKEVFVGADVHGAVYTDGWFEGISWNDCETALVYTAEEKAKDRPVWGASTMTHPSSAPSAQNQGPSKPDAATWKGISPWQEDWGEQFVGKRRPLIFVLHVESGKCIPVPNMPTNTSVGQPVWAPSLPSATPPLSTPPSDGSTASTAATASSAASLGVIVATCWDHDDVIFNTRRRLGMIYCFNRPSSLRLFTVPLPSSGTPTLDPEEMGSMGAESSGPGSMGVGSPAASASDVINAGGKAAGPAGAQVQGPEVPVQGGHAADASGGPAAGMNGSDVPIALTPGYRSAFCPRFSPKGDKLVFISAESSIQTGVHNCTKSLHAISWGGTAHALATAKGGLPTRTVLPVVYEANDPSVFPGLTAIGMSRNPWLPDGSTLILNTSWRSRNAIVAIEIESGAISEVSPGPSGDGKDASWTLLDINAGVAVASVNTPCKPTVLACCFLPPGGITPGQPTWHWYDAGMPFAKLPDKVDRALSSFDFQVLPVPPRDGGHTFEAVVLSPKDAAKSKAPTIVVPHGGPHSSFSTGYVTSHAFLCSLGYNVILVNFRGSTGFGESALQTLPGNIGTQDVHDCLDALEAVTKLGIVDTRRVAVIGGSHGGFLASHLVGQAPDVFRAAVMRNPVCSLVSMIETSDIPDWCFVEAFGGAKGIEIYTDSPDGDKLKHFYDISPISHVDKVKAPCLFLLGGQDKRVQLFSSERYIHALRARGVEAEALVFPDDAHPLASPRTEYDSWVNVALWLRRHLGATPSAT